MDNHKNSEGYSVPTASEAQRHIRAQITGAQSRATGAYFENLICVSCNNYLEKGIAFIEKTPEPMKVLSGLEKNGQFKACFAKSAQPDYKGTLKGGQAIVFEAKHTDNNRIESSRVSPAQREALEHHHKLGAVAFVFVSIGLRDFYRVPWKDWRDMKEIFKRKYIKDEELKQYKVPRTLGYIKFLDGIDDLKKERN